jgi:polyisoprenoid-binding protein YceI
VTCRLTVGGSFEARTAALTGAVAPTSPRPPAFGGSLALDLRTLETGIGLRDQHMRDTYLEVGRGEGFDTAVLSDLRLGDVDLQSFRGRTEFTGTLLLHGVRKPVTGKVEVRRGGDAVDLQATFPVTLSEFGIARPAYLGVGVADVVQVKVALSAQPAAVSASTR